MKRDRMLRLGILAGLVATGLSSAGCTTPNGNPNNTGTDALIGGGVGTVAGGLLGAVAHAPVAGALIGGAAGAATGAAVGNSQDRIDQHQATNAAIAQAQAQAQARLIQPVDVVNMTKSGVDEQNIINQIQTSGCTLLDPPNLQYLQQNGVSSRVIAVMQAVSTRPPGPVVVGGGPVVVGGPPAVYVAPPPVYYGGGYYGGYYGRRW
jgi:osmotically inducible lipoprotein OsmB